MRKLLPLLVIGLVVAFIHRHATRDVSREDFAGTDSTLAAPDPANLQVERAGNEPQKFQCDGRVYCSQMTSCEEATYVLQHCPGAKMDGDGDGIPCEKQWCKLLVKTSAGPSH
jgi:hypothetical protein